MVLSEEEQPVCAIVGIASYLWQEPVRLQRSAAQRVLVSYANNVRLTSGAAQRPDSGREVVFFFHIHSALSARGRARTRDGLDRRKKRIWQMRWKKKMKRSEMRGVGSARGGAPHMLQHASERVDAQRKRLAGGGTYIVCEDAAAVV